MTIHARTRRVSAPAWLLPEPSSCPLAGRLGADVDDPQITARVLFTGQGLAAALEGASAAVLRQPKCLRAPRQWGICPTGPNQCTDRPV